MNTKKTLAYTVLVLLALLYSPHPTAASDAQKQPCNPDPTKDDLILPMPGGLTMVFRPVLIGTGTGPYAIRRVTIGGDGDNFKEHPTAIGLGGAFLAKTDQESGWLYYIGKYEVTQAQYNAVMGTSGNKGAVADDAALPAVNVSYMDVQNFLDRYNQWLFAHALDKLPRLNQSVGFLRLPTEAEWEFAARGGIAVSAGDFDRRVPYDGDLTEYEWFSGPTSSHGKLKPIGQLKPNPLGLYDMLGNAAEMTCALYQLEYYQGRVGGFVARGGSYLTTEEEMRASQRQEQPLYAPQEKQPAPQPFRRPDLSFRVVLSTLVIPDLPTAKALRDGFDAYRQGAGAALPAELSMAADQTKENVQKDDALVHVARLKEALQNKDAAKIDPQRELAAVEAALRDIAAMRREADERQAYGWTVTAADRAFAVHRNIRSLQTRNEQIAAAKDSVDNAADAQERQRAQARIDGYGRQIQDIEANISEALELYVDALRELSHCLPDSVRKALDDYRKRIAASPEQLRVFEAVAKQQEVFRTSGRADTAAWRQTLGAIAR